MKKLIALVLASFVIATLSIGCTDTKTTGGTPKDTANTGKDTSKDSK